MNALLCTLFASLVLATPQTPKDATPPPAKDPVKERLDESPRHHEWIEVASGERKVRCFVAFPEVKEKAPVVLVIHENKGLTDWVRSVADQVAEAGCIAIAPDMLTGTGPNGGNTDSFASAGAATEAIYALDPARIALDLNAVVDHALKLPASNGKLHVGGFCWGGTQTFEFATKRRDLASASVFYGSAPKEDAALAGIAVTVSGFYGESDARITSTVEATTAAMKKAGKTFEPVIYAGAGHGFMRAGEMPNASAENRKARDEAWARWKLLLKPAAAK